MIILKRQGVSCDTSVRDTLSATSVDTQDSGRTFILTNDASPVSENGQLGIITRLQKYGKLADGKKNIDDRAGSKA